MVCFFLLLFLSPLSQLPFSYFLTVTRIPYTSPPQTRHEFPTAGVPPRIPCRSLSYSLQCVLWSIYIYIYIKGVYQPNKSFYHVFFLLFLLQDERGKWSKKTYPFLFAVSICSRIWRPRQQKKRSRQWGLHHENKLSFV